MKDLIDAATEFFRQTLRVLLLGVHPEPEQEQTEEPSDS